MLVQFKELTKYAGKTYRQNARVDFPDATAARLISLDVAELPGDRKGSAGFEAMVDAFRSARAKPSPPPTPAAKAKAAEERAKLFRAGGLKTATQF